MSLLYFSPLKLSGSGVITQRKSGDLLKLLGADADILTLGDATHEGGDLKIYRNATGDLALSFDADAASNTKALDIYGGIVAQNYLTVGAAALNIAYTFRCNGTGSFTDSVATGGDYRIGLTNHGFIAYDNVLDIIAGNIPVTTGSNIHRVKTQIDSNDIIVAQATGDGSGGIVGKRAMFCGGQCHAKTDAGAADYNPSTITSDYIITVDTTAAARAVTISTEDRDSGTAANPRVFIIEDIAGNAGTNAITIALETAGTINGGANVQITANHGVKTISIDGTNAIAY